MFPLTQSEYHALLLSLQVAATAVCIALPLALPVAYLLARRPWRFLWLLETFVNLPLVLPPVVTGFFLLWLFSPAAPFGAVLATLGIHVTFTWLGAALAAAVVSFPLMVRAVRLGFAHVDPRLELAAQSLGASRCDSFCSITLPLAARGILGAMVLGFARSLGEFGATIMVAGNIPGQTQTIPLAIFSLSQRPGGLEQTGTLVLLSVGLACGALLISEGLEARYRRHEVR